MLQRGSDGVPLTTGKLGYSGSWLDAKECIEYIHNKYVIDKKTGKKRTRLYAQCISLGAIMFSNYMGKEKQKVKELVDGVAFYATPWSTSKGWRYFYENGFGLYAKLLGLGINKRIKDICLP